MYTTTCRLCPHPSAAWCCPVARISLLRGGVVCGVPCRGTLAHTLQFAARPLRFAIDMSPQAGVRDTALPAATAALLLHTGVRASLQGKAAASRAVCSSASSASSAVRSAATAAAGGALEALPRVLFSSAVAPGHYLPGHVEQPERVETILRWLKDAGITGAAFECQV